MGGNLSEGGVGAEWRRDVGSLGYEKHSNFKETVDSPSHQEELQAKE